MEPSSLQYLIDILYEAFGELGAPLPALVLEKLAVMLHKNMTAHSRFYHSLEHVVSFYASKNPVQSLAGLFHDIVYYQVDRGFSEEIENVVSGYIRLEDNGINLVGQIPPDDRLFQLTMDVFGFKPGQKLLVNAGLNEFLSALFMNKTLEGLLPELVLLSMTVCIEATIPFRGEDENGQGPFQRMASRLGAINEQYALDLDQAQMHNMLRIAVNFANTDVSSFADTDPGRYLDTTWKLLPEANEALRAQQLYTIRDYRQALFKMSTFLADLDPQCIFHHYNGWPDQAVLQDMTRQARLNLAIAKEYLNIKLLTITLLEALAKATGGDAPVALLMGDLPTGGDSPRRMEDYLPPISASSFVDCASPVYNLLESGRETAAIFDLKNAPLSLYLYCNLPPDRIAQLVELGEAMYNGRKTAQDFLSALDGPVVATVARACAEIARTRRPALLAIAASWDNQTGKI